MCDFKFKYFPFPVPGLPPPEPPETPPNENNGDVVIELSLSLGAHIAHLPIPFAFIIYISPPLSSKISNDTPFDFDGYT